MAALRAEPIIERAQHFRGAGLNVPAFWGGEIIINKLGHGQLAGDMRAITDANAVGNTGDRAFELACIF